MCCAAFAATASAVIIAFTFIGVGALSMVGRDGVRSHRLTTSRVKTSGVSLLMLLMLTSARAQEVGSGNDEEMQAADSAVLRLLYESTGGAGWTNNSGWGDPVSCNAVGVECGSGGEVVAVEFVMVHYRFPIVANILAGYFLGSFFIFVAERESNHHGWRCRFSVELLVDLTVGFQFGFDFVPGLLRND